MDRFKYFHIDKTGKVAIDSGKYDSVGSFKDGLAIGYLENSGRGFIDNGVPATNECDKGKKARSLSNHSLVASGMNNPSLGSQSIQMRPYPLTERSFVEH